MKINFYMIIEFNELSDSLINKVVIIQIDINKH